MGETNVAGTRCNVAGRLIGVAQTGFPGFSNEPGKLSAEGHFWQPARISRRADIVNGVAAEN